MFAGIDIGSLSCEAVIFDGIDIRSFSILPTGSFPRKAAEDALSQAIQLANISSGDIKFIVCTGYGRNLLSNQKPVTEISCFAFGASFIAPGMKMVIDIGGQDSKVIALDENGFATDFITNEKCAAGTGRFLETIARALNLQVDELSNRGHTDDSVTINSTCGVFAESEIVGLLATETPIDAIISGVNKSIALKALTLVRKIGIPEKIMFCGGVSKNKGVKIWLEKLLGKSVFVPREPQIIGALGAAIIASKDYLKLHPNA